ncbi:thioredoxin family protein [Xanthobacter sp. 126]|uniref:thioredoxin family protein n=1 Tax=Xanthobacter sp. 126 TaxID=1131814 RepID=UPI000684D00B|nr:thioredoxin family protein [Xanthobacter sp. 126]
MDRFAAFNGEGKNAELIAVVKKECDTCRLVEPVLAELQNSGAKITIYTQDDPTFPASLRGVIDDTELEKSFHLDIETVPTLIKMESGAETGRVFGWHREQWKNLLGVDELFEELPVMRPGCGSLSVQPGMPEILRTRFGDTGIEARKIEVDFFADPIEACYDRGWTDGLPVVPPTPERILRMLEGTSRPRDQIIGRIPPNLSECTIEKVAIAAVMAGCKPEYMPAVIGAIETALEPNFTWHGIICSTCSTSPLIIVNGPIAKRIGMNSGLNVLGQGNRANATIGRALNLLSRNFGGAKPGEIDRSALGAPSKYTFCFAEDESNEEWEPLSVSRGIERGKSAVTLFQGEGIQLIIDQKSRTAEQLAKSMAMSLCAVGHPKMCQWCNAVLVISPEHYAVYKRDGWNRQMIHDALVRHCRRPGNDLLEFTHGVGEGVLPKFKDQMVDKFNPEGLLLVRAGGPAGLYSAILAGWPTGRDKDDTYPITREIADF